MDFEKYFQAFEDAVKSELSSETWDKVFDRAEDWAMDFFSEQDADGEPMIAPEEAAEEFVSFVKELDAEGSFSEAEEPWSVEYKDVYGNREVEKFATETDAWARYNELDNRTFGDMADIDWVEEPKGPANEDGSSAASLGVGPTAAKHEGLDPKDVEDFLSDALEHFTIGNRNPEGPGAVVKFSADAGNFYLTAMRPGQPAVTLAEGNLIPVVDVYREYLYDLDDDEALARIESA